jgi:hypothetical protein
MLPQVDYKRRGTLWRSRDLYAEHFAPALSGEERGHYYDEAAYARRVEDHVAWLRRAEALLAIGLRAGSRNA